jgi:hypothetical protein
MFRELQDYYFKVERPKVNKLLSEFKGEMGAWGKCQRLDYLYDCLIKLDLDLIERQREYQKSIKQDRPYIERALIASFIPEIEKEITRLEREIGFIVQGSQQKNKGITPEMIEQAQQYPLEYFIELKRNTALCPFHDDHHPSMGIKNNRFHCFACGAKGDVIEFVMKRDGLSFREAITTLIGG